MNYIEQGREKKTYSVIYLKFLVITEMPLAAQLLKIYLKI